MKAINSTRVTFRLDDHEIQKLTALTNVAMANPSDTLRFLIRGVSVEEMEAIREQALKQQDR